MVNKNRGVKDSEMLYVSCSVCTKTKLLSIFPRTSENLNTPFNFTDTLNLYFYVTDDVFPNKVKLGDFGRLDIFSLLMSLVFEEVFNLRH